MADKFNQQEVELSRALGYATPAEALADLGEEEFRAQARQLVVDPSTGKLTPKYAPSKNLPATIPGRDYRTAIEVPPGGFSSHRPDMPDEKPVKVSTVTETKPSYFDTAEYPRQKVDTSGQPDAFMGRERGPIIDTGSAPDVVYREPLGEFARPVAHSAETSAAKEAAPAIERGLLRSKYGKWLAGGLAAGAGIFGAIRKTGEENPDAAVKQAGSSVGGTNTLPESEPAVNTPSESSSTSAATPPATPPKEQAPSSTEADDFTSLMAQAKKYAGAPPSEKNIRSRMALYDQAAAALRDRPGVDTSDIDAQIAEAKQLYREKASRNQMLELAQLIGQGLIKAGAYAEGARTGRLIAPGIEDKGIDYGKRTEQALDEYKTEGTLADKARQARTDAYKERRIAESEALGAQREGLRAEEDIYNQKNREYNQTLENIVRLGAAAKQGDRDAQRQLASERKLAVQTALADNRDASNAAKQLDESARRTSQYIAAVQDGNSKLANALAKDSLVTEDDIALAEEAAKKQVDPGFWTSSEEKAKIGALMQQNLLSRIKEQAAALQERQARNQQIIRSGAAPEVVAGTVPPAQAPAENKRVTKEQLQKYMNDFKVPEQAARQYLQSQGFSVE